MAAPRHETTTGVSLHTPDATLQAWLTEDLGEPPRDVTSEAIFQKGDTGAAHLVTREPLVVAGLEEALRVFTLAGAQAAPEKDDATQVPAGTRLATIRGPVLAILKAERLALNILAHASAIATRTHGLQQRISTINPHCKIAATRKTTPGIRALEKRAVVHGGGDAHRWGLWDMILVKDNHRAAGGELAGLIKRLQQTHPELPLQVEVETRQETETAAHAGVDWILIDNQGPETVAQWTQTARGIHPGIRVEASGGITEKSAPEYAATGVDRVSMGRLTQDAGTRDIALDWDPGTP